ncbi:MAG: DUF4230 domain-containing protein [Verrucomicrobiales bacterium]
MEHRVEMWRTLRWIATLAFVVALTAGMVWRFEKWMSGTKAGVQRSLEQVLGAVTNTDTRIVEGRAEMVEESEVSELALMKMRLSATRTIEKTERFSGIPLGTKRLIVRGYYDVNGGYRLKDGVSLRVERGVPVASFPRAEVLSVELVDFDVLSEDEGWLNKIQPEDRAQILRELRAQMKQEARESGLLDSVEARLQTRLRDLLGVDSVRIEHPLP